MPKARSEPLPVMTVTMKGTFGGLFLAAFAGPAMLIAGAMFCLTGSRTFAGVSLMVGGILTPLAGTAVGLIPRGERRLGRDKASGDQFGDDRFNDRVGGKRLATDSRMGAAA
jgi:hypothetical protein